MILRRRGIPFRRVDVSQVRGEPRSPEFLTVNPIRKVPAVLLEDGDMLRYTVVSARAGLQAAWYAPGAM
jgi:glutathione S-transferase